MTKLLLLGRRIAGGHGLMMAVCIALMAVAVFGLRPGSESGWIGLAPLAICVLMHVVMHRAMGHRHQACNRPVDDSSADSARDRTMPEAGRPT